GGPGGEPADHRGALRVDPGLGGRGHVSRRLRRAARHEVPGRGRQADEPVRAPALRPLRALRREERRLGADRDQPRSRGAPRPRRGRAPRGDGWSAGTAGAAPRDRTRWSPAPTSPGISDQGSLAGSRLAVAEFTPEQQEFRRAIAKLVDAEVAPVADEIDAR